MLCFFTLLLPVAFAADPTITVGPIVAVPTKVVVPVDVPFASCATTPIAPADSRPGTVVFQVQLRRGHVSLVSVVSEDTAVAGYQPCLQRVLADYSWPVKRANFRIPISVRPSEPSAAPSPPPAQAVPDAEPTPTPTP
jgi:hypothetical protein